MTRIVIAFAAATLGLSLGAPLAQAAPVAFDHGLIQTTAPSGLQDVRWVCGPYRCRWVPHRRPYYWAPPPRYWYGPRPRPWRYW